MGDIKQMTDSEAMTGFELDLDSTDFCSSRIYKAIKGRALGQLLRAIHQGEDVNLRDHEFHTTYLHLVVSVADPLTEDRFVPMVYQLSNAGINVHAKDYKGRTALELAVGRELQDIMVALIRVGVDPTDRDYCRIVRNLASPFELELLDTLAKYAPGMWAAVAHNNTGMIHMLVNSWCRINTVRNGLSLIDFAKETNKSEELITVLEDFEVTIEFVHATLAGDEKRMLEFLMDSKPCDPAIMDISYQERWSMPMIPRSLRDTAKAMGHMHVLHLLPETVVSEDEDEEEEEVQYQEEEEVEEERYQEPEQQQQFYENHDEVFYSNRLPLTETQTWPTTEYTHSDLHYNLTVLEDTIDKQSVTGSDKSSSKNSLRGISRSASISTTKSDGGKYVERWYNFHDNKGSRHSGATYMTPGLGEDFSKNWRKDKKQEKMERKYSLKKAVKNKSLGGLAKNNKESRMCVIS